MLSSSSTKASVTLKLSQLQNLCKRDPEGYREDYQTQLVRFTSECDVLAMNPSAENSRFVEVMQFVCAVVSKSYREDANGVAATLMGLLGDKGGEVSGPEVSMLLLF